MLLSGLPLSDLPWWLLSLVGFIVVLWGASLGSFTTCVVYRVPRGLSLWRQANGSYRSFCPNCHAELQTRDLIPILSWLLQRGRCRYCGVAIPARYLIIELAILTLVLGLFAIFGLTLLFFAASLMIPVLAGLGSFLLFRNRL